MAIKKIQPMALVVAISALTSLLVTGLSIFLYVNILNKPFLQLVSPEKQADDSKFASYESLINNFLGKVRKEEVEGAYKETSPVFQKLTTFEEFKQMLQAWQGTRALPAASCTVTEYSEPFTANITGLTNEYTIVQTKCEATEDGKIKVFTVEFIEDNGTQKISYINAYNTPVIHKK